MGFVSHCDLIRILWLLTNKNISVLDEGEISIVHYDLKRGITILSVSALQHFYGFKEYIYQKSYF